MQPPSRDELERTIRTLTALAKALEIENAELTQQLVELQVRNNADLRGKLEDFKQREEDRAQEVESLLMASAERIYCPDCRRAVLPNR